MDLTHTTCQLGGNVSLILINFQMAAMKELYHYGWNSCGQSPQPDISDVHVYSVYQTSR